MIAQNNRLGWLGLEIKKTCVTLMIGVGIAPIAIAQVKAPQKYAHGVVSKPIQPIVEKRVFPLVLSDCLSRLNVIPDGIVSCKVKFEIQNSGSDRILQAGKLPWTASLPATATGSVYITFEDSWDLGRGQIVIDPDGYTINLYYKRDYQRYSKNDLAFVQNAIAQVMRRLQNKLEVYIIRFPDEWTSIPEQNSANPKVESKPAREN